LLAIGVALPLLGATPPNTVITNTATVDYVLNGGPTSATASAILTTESHTAATIRFLQYAAPPGGAGSSLESVPVAECSTSGAASGPFQPLPGPIPAGAATPLTVPGSYPLAPATVYDAGSPLFVEVTDYDQNRDPTKAETVLVTLDTANGDHEVLRLTETGPSTGVFLGYIQSSAGAAAGGNCRLSVAGNTTVTAGYVDSTDGTDSTAAQALVDPLGLLFDSLTGKLISDVSVTLLEAASGEPATVYCADGVTPYPSSVVSGSSFAACGGTVRLPVGGYQFPAVRPGTYRLRIASLSNYHFPSTASTLALQRLPGAPFSIAAGSRGENFVQNAGPLTRIDVPLDPVAGNLQITKTAGRGVVSPGDYLPYTIIIRNLSSVTPATGVQISDQLPPGFRYQPGSARLNGAPLAAPAVSGDGRTLIFTVGTIPVGASASLRYVTTVTGDARAGPAENVASAVAPVSSNAARAIVLVQDDLFRQRAILMGRVMVGECAAPQSSLGGLANVRIVMEDGRYALTDSEGNWHLDNIRPGTHVVQVDRDSLPKGYRTVPCENDSRAAGRSFSRFVNVRGGSLWRANFYLSRPADADVPPKEPAGTAGTPSNGGAAGEATSLVEHLSFDKVWLASAEPGREWLHPQESFQPALPAIKVAIKHLPGDAIDLRVNGAQVGAANYDGTLANAAGTVSLSTWSGVTIREGDNRLEITVHDRDGVIVKNEQRVIHYTETPVRADFVAAQSHLTADGKTRPVIAVRFVDSAGWPIRRGLIGEFEIREPYQARDRLSALAQAPLAGRPGGKPHFEVGADGTALIELAPTTKVGEVVLSFVFRDGRQQEVRTWLKPADRDWILVGFGEATLGHKQLSGNMQALRDADADETLFDGDRVAFYAKGQIRGEYLLTIAYDSAKNRDGNGPPDPLKQAIDPNQYYTLYGDATDPQFDAASTRKLYLRIERSQFYALFGDYDTGLTVTELARYSRTVSGFKSEYKADSLAYNVFATSTAQSYVKDELPGDGTSGPYHLSQGYLVINTDKVRIETRDRFHSEIILATRTLTSYLDYDIDYILGTVFVREPVPVHDDELNPVYLIAEYETAATSEQRLTYGGRAAFRPMTGMEVGVTHIREGNVGASGDLSGVDLTSKLGDQTVVKGEFASSDRSVAGINANGEAWKLEVVHADAKLSGRVYAREEQLGFGLGQQAASEAGTEKIGADGRYKISDAVKIDTEAYRQDTFATGAQRNFLTALAEYHYDAVTARTGVLFDHDAVGGQDSASHQLLGGAAYQMLDRRLTLKADTAVSIDGESGSVDYPDRYRLGADYKLSPATSVFLEQENARGEKLSANLTRLGIRSHLWSGAELASTVGNEEAADASRLFSSLGLTQRWQVNRHWQADIALDRAQTLKNDSATPLNPSVPLASGSPEGDYVAAAAGANYTNGAWSGNGRVEWRDGTTDSRKNALFGLQFRLDPQRTLAAGLIYSASSGGAATGYGVTSALGAPTAFGAPSPPGTSGSYGSGADLNALTGYGTTSGTALKDRKLDGRLGYAWRPSDSAWIWLDRFDVIAESTDAVGAPSVTRKLVNNLNVNLAPDRQTQWSFQYGAKYTFDTIDSARYRGYTDLVGVEVRRDLGRDWDVGADASTLHTWSSHSCDYGLGASVGRRLATNVWVAVGYNVLGFRDNDFAGAAYRARGFYLTVRAKVDEDALGLNRGRTPPQGAP
jgi:uncharacterized repeat protein (TIGR01451 family)